MYRRNTQKPRQCLFIRQNKDPRALQQKTRYRDVHACRRTMVCIRAHTCLSASTQPCMCAQAGHSRTCAQECRDAGGGVVNVHLRTFALEHRLLPLALLLVCDLVVRVRSPAVSAVHASKTCPSIWRAKACLRTCREPAYKNMRTCRARTHVHRQRQTTGAPEAPIQQRLSRAHRHALQSACKCVTDHPNAAHMLHTEQARPARGKHPPHASAANRHRLQSLQVVS